MELFRAQFAGQLPARLEELRTCLKAWQEAPDDDDALAALYRVVHRLAGSAGTFGMPAFGEACRAAEMRLDALREQTVRAPGEVAQVAAQVAALEGLPPA